MYKKNILGWKYIYEKRKDRYNACQARIER